MIEIGNQPFLDQLNGIPQFIRTKDLPHILGKHWNDCVLGTCSKSYLHFFVFYCFPFANKINKGTQSWSGRTLTSNAARINLPSLHTSIA